MVLDRNNLIVRQAQMAYRRFRKLGVNRLVGNVRQVLIEEDLLASDVAPQRVRVISYRPNRQYK